MDLPLFRAEQQIPHPSILGEKVVVVLSTAATLSYRSVRNITTTLHRQNLTNDQIKKLRRLHERTHEPAMV